MGFIDIKTLFDPEVWNGEGQRFLFRYLEFGHKVSACRLKSDYQ